MSRSSIFAREVGELLGKAADKTIPAGSVVPAIQKLRDPLAGPVRCEVTQKGLVAVYGVSKIPICLPPGMWQKLMAAQGDVAAFVATHVDEIAERAHAEAQRKAEADARHERTKARLADSPQVD
jgi:hypothetical protein